jgi:hypothetical protein
MVDTGDEWKQCFEWILFILSFLVPGGIKKRFHWAGRVDRINGIFFALRRETFIAEGSDFKIIPLILSDIPFLKIESNSQGLF